MPSALSTLMAGIWKLLIYMKASKAHIFNGKCSCIFLVFANEPDLRKTYCNIETNYKILAQKKYNWS